MLVAQITAQQADDDQPCGGGLLCFTKQVRTLTNGYVAFLAPSRFNPLSSSRFVNRGDDEATRAEVGATRRAQSKGRAEARLSRPRDESAEIRRKIERLLLRNRAEATHRPEAEQLE